MQLHIIAASNRQPEWADAAFASFAKRFSGPLRLRYTQVRLSRDALADRRKAVEGERLLAATGRAGLIVALDEKGQCWSTRQLADEFGRWMSDASEISFLIGGPDGLCADVLDAARVRWSLSRLTLPHALARVLATEALYRASSLLAGHPYHRD
jgi:23S rRNA (pseudouridine1915-N3)-methyltransferase